MELISLDGERCKPPIGWMVYGILTNYFNRSLDLITIGDKRNVFTVLRPTGHIDGTLSAVDIANNGWDAAGSWH